MKPMPFEMMMRAISSRFRGVCVGVLLVALTGVLVSAHEITVKGTVAAIERVRIQVKTGDEKKGQSPEWYQIDAKTKVMRGSKVVAVDEARIAVGEKVVLLVDHDAKGVMKTLEIRLADR
jgi:hypothetical protein